MPKYPVRLRERITKLVLSGVAMSEISAKYGISRTTLRRWRAAGEEQKHHRSKIMRSVKSRGSRIERTFSCLLLDAHLPEFEQNADDLPGRPDIVFRKQRLAIFIDSCFWHGCRLHHRRPKTNKSYWDEKLKRNHRRDTSVNRTLREMKWVVVRVWEHEISRPEKIQRRVERIARLLDRPDGSLF